MKRSLLLGTLLVLLPLGCKGDGGAAGGTTGGAQQSLTVLLGSDSNPDLQQAVVSVEKVEISANGSTWTTLGSPRTSGNLLSLQGGHELTLLSKAPVSSPGTYAFRITWATTNYADGTRLPAYVIPAGAATGSPMAMPVSTVFAGTVSVPSNGSATALLMMDSARGIQAFQGASLSYAFNPSPSAFDASATATITGTLSAGASALSGVEVFAEVVNGSGTPSILRRALSDASGHYVLDALPSSLGGLDPLILVVAMPCSSGASYSAQGAGPVHVTAPGTYSGANLDFAGTTTPGAIALHVTPQTPAGAVTLADLRQDVAFGSATAYVIVRSQTMVSGASADDYVFANLPQSFFGVNATRADALGSSTQSSPSGVLVAGGSTTNVTLGF